MIKMTGCVLMMAVTLSPSLAQAKEVSLEKGSLAEGPFAKMEMLVERTFFSADVAKLVVRFGKSTQSDFERILSGKTFSENVAKTVANEAIDARDMMVQMKFLRNIGFGQFESEVKNSVKCAQESGMVDKGELGRVTQGLPLWFSAIKERGIKEGDLLIYRVQGDAVRTVLLTSDSRKLVDYTHRGPDPRGSVMGSYFASCSDFREPLIKSLFIADAMS